MYDKLYREDILSQAYALVRSNKGAPGIDGQTFKAIEAEEGKASFVQRLRKQLEGKTCRADAVRRVWIAKPDGSQRPLGIPTIRDRVVQRAVKIVMEPIFKVDFCEHSYGFHPKRSAHDDDAALYSCPSRQLWPTITSMPETEWAKCSRLAATRSWNPGRINKSSGG